MATSAAYILQLRSAKDLVEILNNPIHAQLYDLIQVYFTPFCDCDVRTWLVAQITANNQPVIDAIKAMIAARTPTPPPAIAAALSAGYLVDTFCQGTNLMGRYYAGQAGPVPSTLEAMLIQNHPSCAPPDEYWIKDSFEDTAGTSMALHLPDIGGNYSTYSNAANPRFFMEIIDSGVEFIADAMMDGDDSNYSNADAFLTNHVYVNEALIDSTQAELGVTFRTGITQGLPDWPPYSRIMLSTRMEPGINFPTTNFEADQLHFEITVRNGDDPSSRLVVVRYYWRDDYRDSSIVVGYENLYNQLDTGEKAMFDDIEDYPKIFTRRSSEGTGYEMQFRIRLVKGMWELYLNNRFLFSQIYDELGDPTVPWGEYNAGIGYANYSHIYSDGGQVLPYLFKTHLNDYYVRRLTATTNVDLTFAMLPQSRFEEGNAEDGNFDNLPDSAFFILGKIPEERDNNATPDANFLDHPYPRGSEIRFPFQLGGVPEVNGVPDYTGVSFKLWGFIGGGLEEGTLLGTRPNGAGVPSPNRWEAEQEYIDMVGVEFNSVTGRGAFTNTSPDTNSTGYVLMAISYQGQEILSVTIAFTPPFEDSGNPGEYTVGYSRIGFASDLYYPYTKFSLLF